MALLPKKTYSKRGNECSAFSEREKENVDPFDELLSSPLKQNVQFQPLSFWGKEVKDQKSKKKSSTIKCGLYEISDSDELSSPFQRKRKPKTKHSVSKSANKLCTRRCKSNSTGYSLIKRTKPHKSVIMIERKNFLLNEENEKNKGKSFDKTLYFNDNMEETIKPTYKNYDNNKCNNTSCSNLDETGGNFYNCSLSVKSKRSNKNSSGFINQKKIDSKNLNFKIYEDFGSPMQQSNIINDKTFLIKKEPLNSTKNFSETMEETLTPFYKGSDSFKFISVKRNFNYPGNCNLLDGELNCSSSSIEFYENDIFSSLSRNEKTSCSSSHSNVKICEDISMATDCLSDTENKNLIYDDESFINNSLVQSTDKTLYSVNFSNATEESDTIQECQSENTLSDSFDFLYNNNTNLEDFIEELLEQQNANEKNNVTVDSGLSSTSDDTITEAKDEDTVIRIGLTPEKSFVLSEGSEGNKETKYGTSSKCVSQLTSGISELTISKRDEISKLKAGKSSNLQNNSKCADNEDSFLIDLRNVTTKRRGFLNNRYGNSTFQPNHRQSSIVPKKSQKENNSEIEFEVDQTLEISRIADRLSSDWNKTISFANPIFESTRVIDMSPKGKKISQEQINLSKTIFDSELDRTYALKPGKKWFRSMSVLKQIQNGNILFLDGGRLESTRITGRDFESFVQEVVEMQNGISKISNKTVSEEESFQNSFTLDLKERQKVSSHDNSVINSSESNDFFSINDSILTKNVSDKTDSEKLLLNYTVKVIHSEENSCAFKSALGLETSQVVTQEDSIRKESSDISARDFILMQCGQEDVLPFEEYFNERTLINCKKIGEGVYGEVFMCSNTVIKIIPIEGLDKVNGEPQKTFEEIISEVIIASKLSNLRKGEKHRTDGFSEMKRCWCVKGKYPKYLLNLWNDYDQLGSGSENDSPVMFKDDQLYIILELANGGKDLESFVFNSASQSLSIFIQAAFSLAVAEKAFEFEHRDLHWGNVLISETKEKFTTVVLDSTEYKIPTKGVKVCIIDFTLSRINHEGCCIFNDLSVDPGLFTSEGDYQFEIYRMMLKEVNNDWSLFRPRNNIFWLHYMIDKMIKMVRYKNQKAKVHAKHIKDLKTLESVVLEHKDSSEFILSCSFTAIIDKL